MDKPDNIGSISIRCIRHWLFFTVTSGVHSPCFHKSRDDVFPGQLKHKINSHPSSSENMNVPVLPLHPLYIVTTWCFWWLVNISCLSLSFNNVHSGMVIDINVTLQYVQKGTQHLHKQSLYCGRDMYKSSCSRCCINRCIKLFCNMT
jgi:hypothetical protein